MSPNVSQKELGPIENDVKPLTLVNRDHKDDKTLAVTGERDATFILMSDLRKAYEIYQVARSVAIRSDSFRQCLHSLFLTNPEDDLAAIHRLKGERVSGTCEWILEQKEYTEWLKGESSKLLRLIGPPGIGKTMISSFLVDDLKKRSQHSPDTVLAFYFCDSKDEKRNSATAIIRGIIIQLLRQYPAMFKFIEQDYEQMGDRLCNSFDTLWRILRQILTEFVVGKVYVLIDALDECDKSSRESLLGGLNGLLRTRQHLNVMFLITYRPGSNVSSLVHDVSTFLKIDAGKIKADLSKFIEVKVDDLFRQKKFAAPLEKKIRQAFNERTQGTFLWASLIIRDISSTVSAHHVRPKLGEIPSGLSAVYERILSNIDKEYESDAIFILKCVIAARRPLTRRELAMAHSLDLQSLEESTVPTQDIVDEMQDSFKCCEALLQLDPVTHSINLVHQSAKEFLLRNNNSIQESSWSRYRVDMEEANLLMFKLCWRYLGMDEFNQGYLVFQRTTDNQLVENTLSPEVIEKHCFLEYALKEWWQHAFAAGFSLINDSEWLGDNLGRMPAVRDAWLHIAVRKNHEDFVKLLLVHKASVQAREFKHHHSQTGLHLAVKAGYDKLAKLLLDHGADANAQRLPDKQTPLHLAAERGHKSIVELLVEHQVDLNARDADGCAPLHLAVENGYPSVVKLLLDRGADIAAIDEEGQTSIHLALERGYEEITRLLLGYKPDVTQRDNRDRTALEIAARQGKEAIIDLLLEYETESGTKSEPEGETSLHRAIDTGSRTLVEVLISRGANIEARNRQNRTPLHAAVENGHHHIAKYLLDHGAVVNANGTYNMTSLHLAAEEGHEAIVKLLLEYKADVNAKDNTGRTALHLASDMGYSDVVKLLLNNDADSSATDAEGRTALDMALESEHEEVVELLTSAISGSE